MYSMAFICTFLDKRYSVIQCTGYLKPWVQMNDCDDLSGKSLEQGDNNDGMVTDSESANNNIFCLVAVGRIINNSSSSSLLSDIVKPPCFTSKHTIDGKFLSVDQRYTIIIHIIYIITMNDTDHYIIIILLYTLLKHF